MSFVVWKILRKIPRPMVGVIFVLIASVRA
jgi:hypothetical protein